MAAGTGRLMVGGGVAGVGALVLVLAACTGSQPPKVEENLFPADYRREIVNTMPTIVEDPSNIRDAFVSEPALMQVGDTRRYAVCVRFNPKQSTTEYAGNQERIAIFHTGRLIHFLVATREQCGNAAYKPFPELEKICLKQQCG